MFFYQNRQTAFLYRFPCVKKWSRRALFYIHPPRKRNSSQRPGRPFRAPAVPNQTNIRVRGLANQRLTSIHRLWIGPQLARTPFCGHRLDKNRGGGGKKGNALKASFCPEIPPRRAKTGRRGRWDGNCLQLPVFRTKVKRALKLKKIYSQDAK